MNIYIYYQVVNYLQSHSLSTRYNYLLTFIYKLQFISNIICKLSAIIHKLRIICKGYNSSYKQGPTTTLHSYKYQVPLNPHHNPTHIYTRATSLIIFAVSLVVFGDGGVASPFVEVIPIRKVCAQVINRI